MWHERAANAIPAKAHDLLANHERGEVKVSGELLVLPICQNQLFCASSSTGESAELIPLETAIGSSPISRICRGGHYAN